MAIERINVEPSDIGKCFPYKYWDRKARKRFREFEEYGRYNTSDFGPMTWAARGPRVIGKDGLLAPIDQPRPVRNDHDQEAVLHESDSAGASPDADAARVELSETSGHRRDGDPEPDGDQQPRIVPWGVGPFWKKGP